MRYYVNASAVQGGDGSKEKPFKKIQEAANKAVSGDEVIVAPGIYREAVSPVNGGRPHAVILDTVKGAGIREVEDTAMNHSLTVSDEQFERWTAQLKAQLAELEG